VDRDTDVLDYTWPMSERNAWDHAIREGERRANRVRAQARSARRCRVCHEPMLVAPAAWDAHGVCDPTQLIQAPVKHR